MRIIRDKKLATLTFVPVEVGEAEVISAIAALLKPEDKLDYDGRTGGDDGKPFAIFLQAGAVKEEKNDGFLTRQVYVGGVKLTLCGSTNDDERVVRSIRDTCYFGSGGLIFLGETEVDGTKTITTTAKRCKLCGGNMIGMGECEWKTCDTCRDTCEHHYIHGMIHGGDVGDMGMGEYCGKCGRGKPKAEGERKKSKIEHHLAVERELGITILYRDSPVVTTDDAIQLARLNRRYNKAKARQRTLSA